MRSYIYKIAGLNFTLTIPEDIDVDTLLPTMRRFSVDSCCENVIFDARCVDIIDFGEDNTSKLLEQTTNDMGQVSAERKGDGYLFSVSYVEEIYTHHLYATRDFKDIQLSIQWQDRYAGHSINSLLRIAFAQAVAYYDGVSIHGATVMLNNNAYLFLGKSGTGKSTHADLWQKTFEGCELLNDDNPTIRIIDDVVYVYGTPWSGKTPCYKNERCQLRGIVRLQQASKNIFKKQNGMGAFVTLLPGCAVLRFDSILYNKVCDTLFRIIENVKVGNLDCLPNQAAAQMCYESLKVE